jgi:hypothetical protein
LPARRPKIDAEEDRVAGDDAERDEAADDHHRYGDDQRQQPLVMLAGELVGRLDVADLLAPRLPAGLPGRALLGLLVGAAAAPCRLTSHPRRIRAATAAGTP